jgi:hypothetical protein
MYLRRFAGGFLLEKIKAHIFLYFMKLGYLTLLEINTSFKYAFMKE